MKHTKNRKSQSSLEFVSITSFMFVVFIATFVTIEGRMSGVYQEKLYNSMNELGKVLAAEIRMADVAPGDYEREFYLPQRIGGYNYSIRITDKSEVTINSDELDFVVFLSQNVSGDIGKGKNSITKIDDEISITSLCLGGAGATDDNCGEIDCSGWYEYHQNPDGTYTCYNKTGIGYQQCESQGKCKQPNSVSCSFYPASDNAPGVYTCTECQIVVGCSANNRGDCVPNPGATCSGGGICDGSGDCII